ncbi:hypothetical protein T11_5302 [Trichinella zimbabwensis]|uniref:Uncharacterized protein n=1 Tax=Trichinella zimbabwensis TaxID=268475 RepID=A0A0V1GG17_9BILA|nr:hypothetical protein T11_5302 [Trichinella zimbabwensis]
MVSRCREEHNNYFCKVSTHMMLLLRKNLCFLNVLNSSHSRTCLPENCYAHAYEALVSMVAGVRCAVLAQWHSLCDGGRRIPLNTALIFIYYYIISLN